MKLAAAQINPTVGDIQGNLQKIISYLNQAKKQGARLIVFPEMCLTGYPPEDLLTLPSFIEAAERALLEIIPHTIDCAAVIGTVRKNSTSGEKRLHNTAAVLYNGALLGYQDKTLLPDYDVFSERRYFEPSSSSKIWDIFGKRIAITICEDIWHHAGEVTYSFYPEDPVLKLQHQNLDLVINLSSSPYYLNRSKTRIDVGRATVKTLKVPLLLCNQVGGNDSLIFDGYSFYLRGDGELSKIAKGFFEDLLLIDQNEESPITFSPNPIEELFSALVLGCRDYFLKTGMKKACLGLSGGIDSAVAACLAFEALGKDNVVAVTMPSRYTSEESVKDATALIEHLGIAYMDLSIEKPFEAYLDVLAQTFNNKEADVTEENLQARIRGAYLMALSNKFGYLVLSTGNKSEMAMGYMTLYGDMCGGLAILSDVTKRQVYALANWINRNQEIIPSHILTKPPSAELKFNQKDSDSLPDYEIVDHVLEGYVESHLSPEEISKKYKIDLALVHDLIKRIHLNEYKRRQAPPPLRVTKKAFNAGRRFPIAQKWNI